MQHKKQWVSRVTPTGEVFYKIVFHPHHGEAAYFIIIVEQSKELLFLSALETEESFDLSDFGKVIVSGFGEDAKPSEKAWIAEYYNVHL